MGVGRERKRKGGMNHGGEWEWVAERERYGRGKSHTKEREVTHFSVHIHSVGVASIRNHISHMQRN